MFVAVCSNLEFALDTVLDWNLKIKIVIIAECHNYRHEKALKDESCSNCCSYSTCRLPWFRCCTIILLLHELLHFSRSFEFAVSVTRWLLSSAEVIKSLPNNSNYSQQPNTQFNEKRNIMPNIR